jgi:vitamin B12 transporter
MKQVGVLSMKNFFVLLVVFVSTIFYVMCPSNLTFAQTQDTLDVTLVEGRLIEEKLSRELGVYGHKFEVIEGETLEKLAYPDLIAAFAKLIPGMIAIESTRAHYPRIYMNGSTEILYLIDGTRVNNRLYNTSYLDIVGPHNIERIEVLYGGEGLFYGTNAIAGVINIITKKPGDKMAGEVGAGYGSYKYNDFYMNFGGNYKGHKIMATASYDSWAGYKLYPDYLYDRVNNKSRLTRSYDRLNLGLKYSHQFELEGNNNFYVGLMRNSGAMDFPSGAGFLMGLNDRREYLGVVKWDHDVSPNFSYYVKGYFHQWWTDYSLWNLDGSYYTNHKIWTFEDWGVNILSSIRTDSEHELLIGLDYQNYWAKDETTSISGLHEKV